MDTIGPNGPYREGVAESPPKRPRFWWWSWPGFVSSVVAVCAFNLGAYCFDSCHRIPMRNRLEDEAKRHLTRTHPGAVVHIACFVAGGSWGTCNGTVNGRQIQPMTCADGEGCR